MKAMAETDDMRHRVEGQEQRLTRYLSEKIEESDVKAKEQRRIDEQLRDELLDSALPRPVIERTEVQHDPRPPTNLDMS